MSAKYARGKRINIGPASILTSAQARDKAKQIFAAVLNGADPQAESKKAKAHTLDSYISEIYAPWSQAHHRSKASAMNRIKSSFLSSFGKYRLGDITPWNIEKWRSERLKAGTSKSTVNRDIAALKAALRRAVDWGYLQSNPLATIKQMRTDNKAVIRYLTDDEENRLRMSLEAREAQMKLERESANKWRAERGYNLLPELDGFADHLKPMVILDLNTGLRRGEIFNLKWEDIDFDNAMLTVKGHGAKSGQTRHIPLNNEALDTLKSWQKLLKDAGIVNFRFHDIRHHFASRLVMAGVDLNTVRELLGHGDIKMTLRYAHLAPEHKRRAVEKLNFSTTSANEQSKNLSLA